MIAAAKRPIRVLHVLHSLGGGGAERIVCDLARYRQADLTVGAVCLDEVGRLGPEAAELGVSIHCTERRDGVDLRQVGRIAEQIRAFRPDVIHAHQYTPYFYAALAATAVGFGRIIFTEHGRHWPDVVSTRRKMVNQLLRMRRDRVTAVCRFVADALRTNERIAGRNVQVIPNGVPIETYSVDAPKSWLAGELGVAADDPICVQVARLHPVKDHATSVRAFDQVRRTFPTARLALVGEGGEADAIRKLIDTLDLGNNVLMTGVRDDVPRLLAAADLFVLSSVSEAASLSILEAMSAATAVVATDVGGNGEIVRHGVTGLLSPRRDPAAMAANLQTLLADPTRREQMGLAGRRRVQTLYSQKKMHEEFVSLYRQMTGAHA